MEGSFGTFTVLGSGSRGNTAVVSFGSATSKCVLLDAGLTPTQVRKRMVLACPPGLVVGAILLTHLDSDHWNVGWKAQLARSPVPVLLRKELANAAINAGVPDHCLHIIGERFRLGDLVTVDAITVPHDELGSTAFVLESPMGRIGYVTDLGRVPQSMHERFVDLDLLAIESNYDPQMQRASLRPQFLKDRIMGGRGHLSNDQAAEAAVIIAQQSTLQHLVLLHLSRDCNTAALAMAAIQAQSSTMAEWTTVATQDVATKPIPFSRSARLRPLSWETDSRTNVASRSFA
ncbi:MAG: MBL fold metallo-hydrolase [Planctomycetota bacterium]|nr:MBL fold metallo-hydrolase [Planctomycetota bacterium]